MAFTNITHTPTNSCAAGKNMAIDKHLYKSLTLPMLNIQYLVNRAAQLRGVPFFVVLKAVAAYFTRGRFRFLLPFRPRIPFF